MVERSNGLLDRKGKRMRARLRVSPTHTFKFFFSLKRLHCRNILALRAEWTAILWNVLTVAAHVKKQPLKVHFKLLLILLKCSKQSEMKWVLIFVSTAESMTREVLKTNSFLGPKSTKMLKVNSVKVFLLISLIFDPIHAGKFLPQTRLNVCHDVTE